MRECAWVQTIVATKPVPRPKGSWRWTKIFDSSDADSFGRRPLLQLWICDQDLKESMVAEAQKAFGKALEQIVRLGAYPEILYPVRGFYESTKNDD